VNKLTKLGVSALCGSLAAVSSANAGELAVSGGVDMSWLSLEDDSTGNPIGVGSNFGLAGSGELDNGWGVALSIAMNNGNAYSNTNVVVSIPALGDVRISQGVSGGGLDRMDDSTPNVWEEAYATGLSTGINTVSGVAGSANIEITPSAIMPAGLTARVAFSPEAAGSGSADKGSSGAGGTGSGYDVTVSASSEILGVDGLTIYGGMSSIDKDTAVSTQADGVDEETLGITYAMGGFTVGYQISREDLGTNTAAMEYDNTGYGITFNVNDDLSIGYNNYESDQSNSGGDVTAEAESFQVAYTMGGMSIRLAQASIDNAKYQTTTDYDRDARTVSVSLAF
jgi:hypothetical protein